LLQPLRGLGKVCCGPGKAQNPAVLYFVLKNSISSEEHYINGLAPASDGDIIATAEAADPWFF
jgi:hypothetical protein